MNKQVQFIVLIVAALVGAILGYSIMSSAPASLSLPLIAIFILLFAGIIWWALSRNVKAVPASAEANNDAKRLAAPAGHARIYIYRQKAFMGKAQGVDVAIEGIASAQLKGPNFVMADVMPGNYTLTGNMASAPNKKGSLTVTVAADEVAIVEASIQVDMTSGKIDLKRVDEAGRDSILSGQLIQWKAT